MSRRRDRPESVAGEPVSLVELRCPCGHVLEVHPHRESGFVLGGRRTRLGVTMTIERIGPEGSRRYRCRCGLERVVSTTRLSEESRRTYEHGGSVMTLGLEL